MDELKNIEEIFTYFLKDIKDSKNRIEILKITRQQAKEGLTKKVKISIADIYNDVIILKRQGNQLKLEQTRGDLYIKIHILGNKSKRKGKKIYE